MVLKQTLDLLKRRSIMQTKIKTKETDKAELRTQTYEQKRLGKRKDNMYMIEETLRKGKCFKRAFSKN